MPTAAKEPKRCQKPRFLDFLLLQDFMKRIAAVRRSIRCLSSCRTDFPRPVASATPAAHKEGLRSLVRWNNVRSRHRQVLEILRRRSRHIERTVQFASFGAQCCNKPLSLLWKRETVSSLSKGKRRNGVGRLLAATAAKPFPPPRGQAAIFPL